jgi:hypothetical protein
MMSSPGFVGLGAAVGTMGNAEANVQVVVPTAMSFTKMRCYQANTSTKNLTYTLDKDSMATPLTCTINANQLIGSGSVGTAVSFAAGDTMDVGVPGQAPSATASFGLAP